MIVLLTSTLRNPYAPSGRSLSRRKRTDLNASQTAPISGPGERAFTHAPCVWLSAASHENIHQGGSLSDLELRFSDSSDVVQRIESMRHSRYKVAVGLLLWFDLLVSSGKWHTLMGMAISFTSFCNSSLWGVGPTLGVETEHPHSKDPWRRPGEVLLSKKPGTFHPHERPRKPKKQDFKPEI